jgi:hypothetical protein
LSIHAEEVTFSLRRKPMAKETKLPGTSKDQKSPTRPSHEKVLENLDRWANSPGLQPPK